MSCPNLPATLSRPSAYPVTPKRDTEESKACWVGIDSEPSYRKADDERFPGLGRDGVPASEGEKVTSSLPYVT